MKIPKDFMEQAIKNVLEEYGLTEDMSLKDCVEKQVAKKPFQATGTHDFQCENCGCYIAFDVSDNCILEDEMAGWCPYCGQKLDWSGEE